MPPPHFLKSVTRSANSVWPLLDRTKPNNTQRPNRFPFEIPFTDPRRRFALIDVVRLFRSDLSTCARGRRLPVTNSV